MESCVSWGCFERPDRFELSYIAFIDAAGGSGSDSMTLCIGHYDYGTRTVVIDALREAKPPFSPEIVCSEFAALLKSYRVSTAYADRWAGDWPKEQFLKFGIHIEAAPKTKHGLYIDLLPTINSKRLDLLDHAKAVAQIVSLERRNTRGQDIIDHPPGGHDDLSNVIAGISSLAISKGIFDSSFSFTDSDDGDTPASDPEAEANTQWRRLQYTRHMLNGGNGALPRDSYGLIDWRRF